MYRQCPSLTPQYTVVAVVNPADGRAYFFIVPGMNFGLRAAVNQFNRLPEIVVAFLRRRTGIPVTHYFDDYCVCEPSYAGTTGQAALRDLHNRLGIPLADEKHEPMSRVCLFLGIVTDFITFGANRRITLRPKPGRADTIAALIDTAIENDGFTPGAAATLRGKLLFLLIATFAGGRVARAAAHALRVAEKFGRKHVALTAPLWAALVFLRAIIHRLPPRVIDLLSTARAASRAPILIWSDARWEPSQVDPGGMGFVIYIPAWYPKAWHLEAPSSGLQTQPAWPRSKHSTRHEPHPRSRVTPSNSASDSSSSWQSGVTLLLV